MIFSSKFSSINTLKDILIIALSYIRRIANNDIKTARQLLTDGRYTCVLLANGKEYYSHERGVKPLIGFLQSNSSLVGAIAADKTVGAGAAHLYVLLGISALWANVISESAIKVLKDNIKAVLKAVFI